MKPSSLHALVIDRHLGELSPEAVELLETYLADHPNAQAEAERIAASLQITHDAVLRHPELVARPEAAAPAVPARKTPRRSSWIHSWVARAAAVLLLTAAAGSAGFMAGRSEAPGTMTVAEVTSPPAAQARKESPWARYRMTFDPAGEGLQVVRVAPSTPAPSIR